MPTGPDSPDNRPDPKEDWPTEDTRQDWPTEDPGGRL